MKVLPTIYTPEPTQRPFSERSGILFIGFFLHKPNIDAVVWFVREVLPRLSDLELRPEFHVIGSQAPREVKALASETVRLHGYVPDPLPLFDSCRLSVAPLLYGAGVKGKINQSLALGLPCVSTSVGAEGMHLKDSQNIAIADTPLDFASKTAQVYSDERLWNGLREGGLENIRNHFSPAVARNVLEQLVLRSDGTGRGFA